MDEADARALQVEVRLLRGRLETLERLLLSTSCLLVAATLVVGALLPYGAAEEDETSASLLSTIGALLTAVGDPDVTFGPEDTILAVGFVGLLVVVLLLLLLVLPVLGRRLATPRFRSGAWAVAGLGAIGSLIVTLLSLTLAAGDGRGGAGGPVLLAGSVGVALLLSASSADLVNASPGRGPARRYGAGPA